MKNYRKVATVMIVIGFCLTIIAPIIFTKNFGIIDFTETGSIGDTIGGITSPIVGLLGAILVYFALLAQIDANEKIQVQLDLQKKTEYEIKAVGYLNSQFETIRRDINEYEYLESTETKPISAIYKGSEAINKFLKLYKKYKDENEEDLLIDVYPLEQLRLLLEHINYYIISVKNENISKEDKKYLLHNISYQFKSKIKLHLDYFNNYNGQPNRIYDIGNSIDSNLSILDTDFFKV